MAEWKRQSVRDENGEGFDTVQYEEVVMPVKYLEIEPAKHFQDIKEFKYLEGDVFICNFPKTGNYELMTCKHLMTFDDFVNEYIFDSDTLQSWSNERFKLKHTHLLNSFLHILRIVNTLLVISSDL